MLAKIKGLPNAMPGIIDRVSKVALERVRIAEIQRIFEEGKCRDGAAIDSRRKARKPREGNYSRSHGRRRKERGRGTDRVNLDYTGTHRNSLIVGESGGDIVYGFSDQEQRLIAEGHEAYRRKDIYGVSDNALELAKKSALAEIRFLIKSAVK